MVTFKQTYLLCTPSLLELQDQCSGALRWDDVLSASIRHMEVGGPGSQCLLQRRHKQPVYRCDCRLAWLLQKAAVTHLQSIDLAVQDPLQKLDAEQ